MDTTVLTAALLESYLGTYLITSIQVPPVGLD